jgi:WD40 repeat protein/uncharacterized protein YraI
MKTAHIFILIACLLVSGLLGTACSSNEDANTKAPTATSAPLAAIPITASNAAQITQIKTLQGHIEQAFSVAFSPDGALLASGGGSADRTVRLWDTHTGESVRVIDAHQHLVWHIAFSPDGKTMATASEDGTLRLWEVATGKQLAVLDELDVAVFGAAFTPDGKTLASVDNYKAVKLWDVATGQQIGALEGNRQLIQSVAISPDGTLLATGGGDSTVRLWNLATGESLGILGEHGGLVNAVAFSPDGAWVASAAVGGEVTLWNVKTRESQVVVHLGGMVPPGMFSVAFSPDGTVLAFGSMDGTIGLWDMAAGKGLAEIQGHTDAVYGLAFSPDGTLLASAALDGNVILWGIRAGGTAEAAATPDMVVASEASVTALNDSQLTLAASACAGSQAAELIQEFRSATGITVRYPSGWAVKDGDNNTVVIVNKAEYLDIDTANEMPEDVVAVSIMPSFDPVSMGLPASADVSVGQILTLMTRVAVVKDVKVGDKDAARVDVKRTKVKLEGFVIGYKIGDAKMLVAIVGAREGQLSKFECTVMKIIENITYPVPGTPTVIPAPAASETPVPASTLLPAPPVASATPVPEVQIVVVVTMTPMSGVCVLNGEMIISGTGTAGLNVRSEPNYRAVSVFLASEGERVTIIGGPQSANGMEWCQVRREQDGSTGWAARDYLAEAPAAAAPSVATPTTVAIQPATPTPDVQVRVITSTPLPGGCALNREMIISGTGVSGLAVRSAPGYSGTPVFLAIEGERVQIIGGPQFADDWEWCQIRREQDGATGWMARDYLAEAPEATGVPANTPSSSVTPSPGGDDTLLVRSFPPGLEVYVVPADKAVGSFGESYTTHPDYLAGNTPLEIALDPGDYWVTVSKMDDPIDFRADGEDNTVFAIDLDAQGQVTGTETVGKSYLITKKVGHQAIVTALFWPKDQALVDFVASLPEENVLSFTDEGGIWENFLTEIFQTHNIPPDDQPYLVQMLSKTGKAVWYSPDSSQHLYVYFNEPTQVVVDPNVPLPSGINLPAAEDTPPVAAPQPEVFPTDTRADVPIGEQTFEHGHMFWIRRNGQIWVAVENPAGSERGDWFCYYDTFVDGEPETDPALVPPDDLFQPRREFGKLWRNTPGLRDTLGWAVTPEFELISHYTYIAGLTMQDGQYVPGPGEHRLTTLYDESISFYEGDMRGDCGGGTWQIVGQ